MREGLWAAVVVLLGLAAAAEAEELARLPNGDPAMTAAFRKASATLADFVAALRHPPDGADRFSIKVGIVATDAAPGFRIVKPGSAHPGGVEYFWVGHLRETASGFDGAIENDGEDVAAVRAGQSVAVTRAEIADWMYLQNRRIVGNATSCPALAHASETLKRKMLDEFGLDCR